MDHPRESEVLGMNSTLSNTTNIAQIFDSTTNSYKFTLFIGILELIKIKGFKKTCISYEELASMMIAIAWVPGSYFKLNLGGRDQTKLIIDQISIPQKITSLHKLYQHILNNKSINKIDLLEYVPHRLIRPFFSNETRGLRDSLVNSVLENLSQKFYDSGRPSIYKIDSSNKQIKLNDQWLSYLQNNYKIVQGWAYQNWCQYLQKQNPNTPAITNKITLDINRTNLSRQRDAWNRVIDQIDLRCIYTNEKIKKDFHLDHFLPWRFLAHNQLWNLIPTSPEVNIQKSDSIPDKKFITSMAELHYKFLKFMHNELEDTAWNRMIGEYADGVGLSGQNSLDQQIVEDAYKKTYTPLFQIAINNGFTPEWKYK